MEKYIKPKSELIIVETKSCICDASMSMSKDPATGPACSLKFYADEDEIEDNSLSW